MGFTPAVGKIVIKDNDDVKDELRGKELTLIGILDAMNDFRYVAIDSEGVTLFPEHKHCYVKSIDFYGSLAE